MPTSETPRATQLPDGRWQFDVSRYPVAREILRRATERHFAKKYDAAVLLAVEDAKDARREAV